MPDDQKPAGPPRWAQWLWESDTSAQDGDAKGLTVGKIVRAGLELADADGLNGVSVRKLAQRLGASTMAAYRHIGSRDDVVAAMVDVALGEPPSADELSGDWKAGVRRWTDAIRDRYDAHPWLLDSPVGGVPVTPNRLRWMESILCVLARAGLDLQEQLDAALLIDGHVRAVAGLAKSIEASSRESHAGPPAWLLEYLRTDGLTSMSQVFEAGALDDGYGYDLSYGIERIIAGIRPGAAPPA
jgi:AcrR family transcriptional regulator